MKKPMGIGEATEALERAGHERDKEPWTPELLDKAEGLLGEEKRPASRTWTETSVCGMPESMARELVEWRSRFYR